MRLLLVLLLSSLCVPAKTLELEFPGLVHRVLIDFPDNYDPAHQWPAIFYYHGTNGTPNTELIKHHTNDRDWIVVGMSYLQKGRFTLTNDSLNKETHILHSVRNYLTQKHALDPKRVYVAGFSKGGWMSDLLIQHDSTLAGAIILGAGHLHRVQSQSGPFRKRTPIFLGVGRRDGNYPFALRAITYYRSQKAPVTLETWHDLGHDFPRRGSPSLKQWLALEVDRSRDHASIAEAWLTKHLQEIQALEDPIHRWLALRDLENLPYLHILENVWKTKVRAQRESLENHPKVQPETKALTAHRKLLRKEISSHAKENYENLLLAYLKLTESTAGTRQSQLAQHDQQRVERLLKHYEENKRLQAEQGILTPEPEPTINTEIDNRNERRIRGTPLFR